MPLSVYLSDPGCAEYCITRPSLQLPFQAITETAQSTQTLNIAIFFLPMMFFSARLAMLFTTVNFVLAVFVLPWDIDAELGKLGWLVFSAVVSFTVGEG